jgi:hypothetical protein
MYILIVEAKSGALTMQAVVQMDEAIKKLR